MADKAKNPAVAKWWLKNLFFLMITGIVLFLSAGRLSWWMGWLYLGGLFAVVLANARVMDPDLLAERSQMQTGTKKWDVALSVFVAIVGPLLTWLTAGLDQRLSWSKNIPLWAQISALIVVILGGLIGTWAMGANRFFSATVRIQTERGHQVVSGGPYAIVRHPGYLSGIIFILFTSTALASWVALIPAGLTACAFILRTRLEDQTLQVELPGYADYSQKVHYRLLPGIW
jgi:protein-S-isoprenylcysteine O-methyltransferase Ste14